MVFVCVYIYKRRELKSLTEKEKESVPEILKSYQGSQTNSDFLHKKILIVIQILSRTEKE